MLEEKATFRGEFQSRITTGSWTTRLQHANREGISFERFSGCDDSPPAAVRIALLVSVIIPIGNRTTPAIYAATNGSSRKNRACWKSASGASHNLKDIDVDKTTLRSGLTARDQFKSPCMKPSSNRRCGWRRSKYSHNLKFTITRRMDRMVTVGTLANTWVAQKQNILTYSTAALESAHHVQSGYSLSRFFCCRISPDRSPWDSSVPFAIDCGQLT